LQQPLLRIRAQEQDDTVLVAHGYSAHASRQSESGFTGQVGPFKLGYVRQIINLADRGRFSDPDNESETVGVKLRSSTKDLLVSVQHRSDSDL
jgi:hypothetical protein